MFEDSSSSNQVFLLDSPMAWREGILSPHFVSLCLHSLFSLARSLSMSDKVLFPFNSAHWLDRDPWDPIADTNNRTGKEGSYAPADCIPLRAPLKGLSLSEDDCHQTNLFPAMQLQVSASCNCNCLPCFLTGLQLTSFPCRTGDLVSACKHPNILGVHDWGFASHPPGV